MAYRNKTYVCFDGDEDMSHYRLMTAWKAHNGLDFNFHDAHGINYSRDTSQVESIKRQLRTRLDNSKIFVVLIGEKTKNLRKFIPWELEMALQRDLPIIAVNLNGSKSLDDRCPAGIRNELCVHVPFRMKIIAHALDNWPAEHSSLRKQKVTGPRHYGDLVYRSLGL